MACTRKEEKNKFAIAKHFWEITHLLDLIPEKCVHTHLYTSEFNMLKYHKNVFNYMISDL